MINKHQHIHYHIQRVLSEVYSNIEDLLEWMPTEQLVKTSKLNKQQQAAILAVKAIEEEWILDPELREELSMISTESEE